jgi:hypothetical protein
MSAKAQINYKDFEQLIDISQLADGVRDPRAIVTIFNVGRMEWLIERPYRPGGYLIPKPQNGEKYATLVVKPIRETIHGGEHLHMPLLITGADIANDIVKYYRRFGVGVAEDHLPTAQELAEALKQRDKTDKMELSMADSIWAHKHKPDEISDYARIVAEELGLKREWLSIMPETQPVLARCPVCKDDLREGAAVCKSCGAVLDPEVAARFGVIQPLPQPIAPAAVAAEAPAAAEEPVYNPDAELDAEQEAEFENLKKKNAKRGK